MASLVLTVFPVLPVFLEHPVKKVHPSKENLASTESTVLKESQDILALKEKREKKVIDFEVDKQKD